VKYLVAILSISLLAPFASADSWVVRDLGRMPDRATCMDRAELVLRDYKDKNSGGEINRGSWSIYAYGIGASERQLSFSIPTFGGSVYGMIYSHDTRPADENKYAVDRIVEEFKRRY